jgi:hypothetical protein
MSEEVSEFFLALESDATSVDAECMPFETRVSSDMSATWKTAGLGDGARVNVQFCHLCALRASQIHLPNQYRCQNCCSIMRQLYYHRGHVNPSTLAVYRYHQEALERDLERDVDGTTVHAHSNFEHSYFFGGYRWSAKSSFH